MAARGGDKNPVVGIGNYAWDGDAWLRIWSSSTGSMAVWVTHWGVPETQLTGRDVSLDLQTLSDDGVEGVLCSLGTTLVPGRVDATDTSQTLRRLVERVALSTDTIGAATGLMRSVGDAGAGAAVPVTNTSMIRILELMLIALGGGGAIYGVTSNTATVAVAGVAFTLDTAAAGGRDVSYVIDAVGVGGCVFDVEVSHNNVNWHVANSVAVAAGGSSAQFQQNRFRYIRFNRTDAAGTNSTITASAGR